MKTIDFKEIREKVYYEKLNNGMEVYLYPTNKTKNFYATVSAKYGSSVMSYKNSNGKNIEVYPGTAHFLEHKIMNFTTNKDFMNRVNKLGSVTNAYTTYNVTNYNVFGSNNILENISLIFDMVFNPIITDENVKSEKGIINEEIDMDKDDINVYSQIKKLQNLFFNSFPKNHILGEKNDIDKITSSYLKMIYKDFYTPNNLFVIIVGNFNKNEVIDYIKEYMKNIKGKDIITKINKVKEKNEVKISYEEISKNIDENKVYYSLKINKNLFSNIDKRYLKYYLSIILSANFSSTSKLYEKYKKKFVNTLNAGFKIYGEYIIITIKANTDNKEDFLKEIQKDINKLALDEKTFNRKKRKMLGLVILGFENLEDVEFYITDGILENKKFDNKDYSILENLKYEEALKIIKNISSKYNSILVCKE